MRAPALAAALLSFSASAHIKLTEPESFQITNALGNPQKSEPCGGPGTASNAVTEVVAGSQLTVTWQETILHPGHFRIGIAQAATDFRTPTPVLNQNGANCASAPIEATPAYPTLVDGLFPHTSAAPNGTYSTTVTVPQVACERCVLQLMQFMSSHAPPCFYYQCATLKIVLPPVDAGVDAGTDAGVDAGLEPSDAGGAPVDAGQNTGGGGGMVAAGGGSGNPVEVDGGVEPEPEPMGCSCGSTPFVGVLVMGAWLLRRRRASDAGCVRRH